MRGRDPFRTTCAKHHRFKTDEGICAGGEEESEVWSSGTVSPLVASCNRLLAVDY